MAMEFPGSATMAYLFHKNDKNLECLSAYSLVPRVPNSILAFDLRLANNVNLCHQIVQILSKRRWGRIKWHTPTYKRKVKLWLFKTLWECGTVHFESVNHQNVRPYLIKKHILNKSEYLPSRIRPCNHGRN